MTQAMPARRPSVRRLLLGWLLPALVLLVPLGAALIYWLALLPAHDALDSALTDTAVALSRIVHFEGDAVTLPISEQTAQALRADLVDQISFAVVDPAGHLLGGSAALAARAPNLAAGEWAFFDAELDGVPVRIAALGQGCGGTPLRVCAILVAETQGKRAVARRAALLGAGLGALAIALPLIALTLLAVRRALHPLEDAAAQVARLTPDRLQAVDDARVPREAAGFVQALNGLLSRLRQAGDAQRAFVADAAHQLRTPLAVVRVEAAELLSAPHAPSQAGALARLHRAAERGTRLVQQLLALARAEGAALDTLPVTGHVDLARLAAAAANDWLPTALAAGQDLGFELAPAPVRAQPALLAEMLDNLVHNALVHGGAGARITLSTRTDGPQALLVVEDDGPGVPEDEREGVWQRFRRGRAAGADGSGLGLAIVADIARLHGATARMEAARPDGRGCRVTVAFAAEPPAASSE